MKVGEDLLVDTYHFTAVGIASLTDGLFFASSRRGPCQCFVGKRGQPRGRVGGGGGGGKGCTPQSHINERFLHIQT